MAVFCALALLSLLLNLLPWIAPGGVVGAP